MGIQDIKSRPLSGKVITLLKDLITKTNNLKHQNITDQLFSILHKTPEETKRSESSLFTARAAQI